MSIPTVLSIINTHGSINFDSIANYDCVSESHTINTNSFSTLTANNDIYMESYTGNIDIIIDIGIIKINSFGNHSNAIIIEATNSNGGILQTAGTGGINLTTSNGDINLLSQGSNINIGVSPDGTPAQQQTHNLNLESFNEFNVNSGDMYFVSSDIISFVSNTGDIQFGTSSNGSPIIKFENGNVLINQSTSYLDYQLDVAVSHSSDNRDGYNGIMINTKVSNVAADLTLQTSNVLGDGTQCILSLGSFGLDNKQSVFQKYLAFQTSNIVIRLDGPAYSPNSINSIDNGFGFDFKYSDIGRQIYWTNTDRLDIITGLSSIITSANDTSNISVSGSYTGNTSRVYLLQIDSLASPNTFKWSNNGGVSFQNIYVPISAFVPISLDSGLSIIFAASTGFFYNQQFTFQTKITALVENTVSIAIPETMYTLQPFYSYIETTTPSDIVIKTNSSEKLRITGDGAIGIQKQIPTACLDLNCNYNKVLMVNQSITGYQLNPSIGYLESGGYVIVWNTQDTVGSTYNFNVIGQRYMSDGSRYGSNFQVNILSNLNQSFPSIAGHKEKNSNHFIVAWASNDTVSGLYNTYCQIYNNGIPIKPFDIALDTVVATPTTSNQVYPRAAGLYNGSYIVVWAGDDISSGIYIVYGIIINDIGTITNLRFQISPLLISLSRNYPYVAGIPSTDADYPNGFVVSYMCAVDTSPDPRYSIALRVFNFDLSISSLEIPITTVGSTTYSSISDGLLSVAEIIKHNTNTTDTTTGCFVLSFYRSYQADATLYNIGDNVSGVLSGSTASIALLDPVARIISLQNISNRFLIAEEIEIVSSNPNVGNIVEKVSAIEFTSNNTANITLDIGSKDVMAYCFNSNISQASDARWSIQVNTSLLYNDLDRFTGNANLYQYKRPLASVSVDNNGSALIAWSNGSIPSIYYQLINTDTGIFISSEQRVTSQYDGLKQRDQVVTHLQSIEGNDYGFILSWDNQSLDLQDTGIYQQLLGYNHSLFKLEDGNSNLIFNHQNQLGIGIIEPSSTLHIKSALSSSYGDPPNTCALTLQNTSQHVITNSILRSINFSDGSNNIMNQIQSVSSLRYDDLYPQPTHLIGFYKFDHSTGTQVVDYSTSSTFLDSGDIPVYVNTNGILINFDIENCWVPGLINNALLFDGYDDYVFIENNALNGINKVLEVAPHTMTLSLWINVPNIINVGSQYDIISNGGNLTIPGTYLLSLVDLSSNGSLYATSNIIVNGINNISIIGNTKLNDSSWHNIVETIDMSSGSNCIIELYIDGVLETSTNSIGTVNLIQHSAYKTYIGSSDGINNFYRGYIDELRIYNSIITQTEIMQLYKYGNPTVSMKSAMILNANYGATYNQAIVIDDDGKINNLSSRPLPYTSLSGELVVYNSNASIYGINTKFINELTIGDIIVLGVNQDIEYTIITILDNNNASMDRRYGGTEASKSYVSVLRRPSIYTFFDNSDSIRGHIDNYGNMMIGSSRPTTMLEISGESNNINSVPELTITNNTQEDTQYSRATAINFKCYNTSNVLDTQETLARIETSHYGNNLDMEGIMKLSVNNGTALNTIMSLTSNGNIGIGFGLEGQNSPLTLIHATSSNLASGCECEIFLQSNYNTLGFGVFDERSDIYFGGVSSITEVIDNNIKKRVLSAVSGSNDSNTKALNGRIDLLTNNENNGNGIESRMTICHTGNVGVSILQPASTFQVAPEIRLTGQLNTIVNTASSGTVITLSNNIFSGYTTPQRNLFIGGCVVIENDSLTRANIVSVNTVVNNQITVSSNLALYVGNTIHIHYPGFNVIESGLIGINTTVPGSILSIVGSMSLPITTVSSSTTIDITHYTVICDTSSIPITITLPINNTAVYGRIYIIKKLGANLCYVNPNGAVIDNISGLYTISTFVKLQSNGTNWFVIG